MTTSKISELLGSKNNRTYNIGDNDNLNKVTTKSLTTGNLNIGNNGNIINFTYPDNLVGNGYSLVLPNNIGVSGEFLGIEDGNKLIWRNPNIMKNVYFKYGSGLNSSLIDENYITGRIIFPDNYNITIKPSSTTCKLFFQFRCTFIASFSADTAITFYIYKTVNNIESEIQREENLGPTNAAGTNRTQYVANSIIEPGTLDEIKIKIGYSFNKINTNSLSFNTLRDRIGILGEKDTDPNNQRIGYYGYKNSIFVTDYDGSGGSHNTTFSKSQDNESIYYNSGTTFLGKNFNSYNTIDTSGISLKTSENITAPLFIGNINGNTISTHIITSYNLNSNVISTNVLNSNLLNVNFLTGNNIITTNIGTYYLDSNIISVYDISVNNSLKTKDLDVFGNLHVHGTQTIVNSEVLNIADNIIIVNADGNIEKQAGIQANIYGNLYNLFFDICLNGWSIYNENLHLNKLIGNNISLTENITALWFNGNLSGTTVKLTDNVTAPLFNGNLSGVYAALSDNVRAPLFNGNLSGTTAKLTDNVTAPLFNGNLSGVYAALSDNVKAPLFNGNLSGTTAKLTDNVTAPLFNGNLSGVYAALSDNVKAPLFNGNLSGTTATLSDNVRARLFNGNLVGDYANLTNNVNASLFNGNLSGDYATLTNNVSAPLFNGNLSGYYANLTDNVTAPLFNGNLNSNYVITKNITTYDISVNNSLKTKDLDVFGNLHVHGTQTIINSEILNVADNIIIVNADGNIEQQAGLQANIHGNLYNFLFDISLNGWSIYNQNLYLNKIFGNNISITENINALWFNGNLSGTTAKLTDNVTAPLFNGNLSGQTALLSHLSMNGNINLNNNYWINDVSGIKFSDGTILPRHLPKGNLGDVIISDGSTYLETTNKLNINPTTGIVSGDFINIANKEIKLGESAGIGIEKERISIGWFSGTHSNMYSVCLGHTAGQNSGVRSVSIGTGAGYSSKDYSISIGHAAGFTAGGNSISLGYNANAKKNGSIVINSTGIFTDSITNDACYINPIRSIAPTKQRNVLQYDTLNKELVSHENLIVGNINCVNLSGITANLTDNVIAPLFIGNLSGTTANLRENVTAPLFIGNLLGISATLTDNVTAPLFIGNLSGISATLTDNVTAPLFIGNLNGDIIKNNLFLDVSYININNIFRGNTNNLNIISNSLKINNSTTLNNSLYVKENAIFNKDITVTGNLKVQGTKTEIITIEYSTNDNIITLNSNGNKKNFGIEGNIQGNLYKFLYDPDNDYWTTYGKSLNANIIGDISGNNANFKEINISGNISANNNYIIDLSAIKFSNGVLFNNIIFENKINNITSNILTLQGNISTLQTNDNNIIANIIAMKTDISNNKGNISTLQGNISTLQGNISTLQGNISTLQTNDNNIIANIIAMKTDITNNKGNISTLQGNISTLQGNISTLQGNISTLQTNDNNIIANIIAMKTDISNNKGNISTLQGNISTLQGNISTLQGNISTLQGNIISIENRLGQGINIDFTNNGNVVFNNITANGIIMGELSGNSLTSNKWKESKILNVSGNVSGNVLINANETMVLSLELENFGKSGIYGNNNSFPIITLDNYGRVTDISLVTLSLTGGGGTNTDIGNYINTQYISTETLAVSGYIRTSKIIGTTIEIDSNDVIITDKLSVNKINADSITLSDEIKVTKITSSNALFTNDVTITGNLSVLGTQTILHATTVEIDDNIIVVNADGQLIGNAGINANIGGNIYEFVYNSLENIWTTNNSDLKVKDLKIDSNINFINGNALIYFGDDDNFIGRVNSNLTINGDNLTILGKDKQINIGSESQDVPGNYLNDNNASINLNRKSIFNAYSEFKQPVYFDNGFTVLRGHPSFEAGLTVEAQNLIIDPDNDENGGLGIGIRNPDADLDVNGLSIFRGNVDFNEIYTKESLNYVYKKSTFKNSIDITSLSITDNSYSYSVAPNSNFIVIGNYKYSNNTGNVCIFDILNNNEITINNPNQITNDLFGYNVIYDNNGTVAIGSPGYDNNRGKISIYSFHNSQLTYNLLTELSGNNSNENFGYSFDYKVLNSSNTYLAAISKNTNSSKISIYHNNGSSWSPRGSINVLLSNDSIVKINNHGDKLLVTNPNYDHNKGFLCIYTYNGSNSWVKKKEISGINGDFLGKSVSINKDFTILGIGSPGYNNNKGKFEVYKINYYYPFSADKIGNTIYGTNSGSNFGISSSIDDDGIIISVCEYNDNPMILEIYIYMKEIFLIIVLKKYVKIYKMILLIIIKEVKLKL